MFWNKIGSGVIVYSLFFISSILAISITSIFATFVYLGFIEKGSMLAYLTNVLLISQSGIYLEDLEKNARIKKN